MQGGFALRRSQSSLIELLIIAIGVSASLTILLYNNYSSIESLRSVSLESEEVLINYLNYKPSLYNETNHLLITQQCNNHTFYEIDSYFFNETRRAIEWLNDNNSFIIFINISNNAWKVYNNQETVCLRQARLSKQELRTPCGDGYIIYGSWKGEAPLTC